MLIKIQTLPYLEFWCILNSASGHSRLSDERLDFSFITCMFFDCVVGALFEIEYAHHFKPQGTVLSHVTVLVFCGLQQIGN
jgi:hypothetical protein